MIRLVGIGGAPASGKSTLMKWIIKGLGQGSEGKAGTLRYTAYPEKKAVVLGIYDGRAFQGTDALSMSVLPKTLECLRKWDASEKMSGWTVLFEGDRLFSPKLLSWVEEEKIPHYWFLLEPSAKKLLKRRATRDQNPRWVSGRETKLFNMRRRFKIQALPSSSKKDLEDNVKLIFSLMDWEVF